MLPSFAFAPLPHTVFGAGAVAQLSALMKCYTGNILLVTGANSYQDAGIQNKMEPALALCGRTVFRAAVSGEPSPASVDGMVARFRGEAIGCVVAVGGGSVIDTGKAVSAMLHLDGSVQDYLEGVGHKNPDGTKVPFIAIPTTAGTGSEATKNAPIGCVGPQGFKKSLRHDNYIPNVALIDPELALGCPPAITAACGLDAFTQLLESYVSVKASPLTDVLAWQGLELAATALPRVVANGADLAARADMAYAAYLSGVTLANAGLGLVHGFAGTLGGYYRIPHGVACAVLLPIVTAGTIAYLRKHDPESGALDRYARVGSLFAGLSADSLDSCQDVLVRKLRGWLTEFSIAGLAHYGVCASDLERIARESGPKENPGRFTLEDKMAMLRLAL